MKPTTALTIALSLLAVPLSAQPPGGRTYFVVALGLEGRYAASAFCFEFGTDGVSSLGGDISGSWERTAPGVKTAAIVFTLTVQGAAPVEIDGHGRVDVRGPGSSIAGTGRARTGGSKLNFAFAGREVRRALCPDLQAGLDGEDDPDPEPDIDVVGSGNVVSESRSVAGFHAVSVGDTGRLIVDRTGSESLTITAEDNILPILESRVRNGTLHLGIRSSGDVRTTREIVYRLSARNLERLTVDGSVDVDASRIETESLTIDLGGSSTIAIEGRAEHQELRLTGSASYQAGDLRSRSAAVELSGDSHALVRVSESIVGSAGGSSSLEYLGDPTVDVETSGSASVRRVGG